MPNKSPENILLVIPEMIMGGAARSLAKLSLELKNRYRVWIVVFNEAHEIPYTLGGELLSLDVFPGADWFSKLKAFYQRIIRLRAIKRKLKINISISFLEGADYINILSRSEEKIFISIRGSKNADSDISGFSGWLRRRLLMPGLYKRADKVICVSHGIAEEMATCLKIDHSKIQTIYNFYDINSMFEGIDQKSIEPFDLLFPYTYILGAGRLHHQKNFKGLIEVFSHTKQLIPKLKLVILGNGSQKQLLADYAESLSLKVYSADSGKTFSPETDDVFLLGFQQPALFLKHATLFTLTSSWEGFPNVVIEALACGAMVVSTDCQTGPREILADRTSENKNASVEFAKYGVLMPLINSPEHIRIWSETINNIINDPRIPESYKALGKERVKDFSGDKIIDKWYNLIENA